MAAKKTSTLTFFVHSYNFPPENASKCDKVGPAEVRTPRNSAAATTLGHKCASNLAQLEYKFHDTRVLS